MQPVRLLIYTTASYFKRHVLTHSGETALICTQYTSSFTQSCLLKRHLTDSIQRRSISSVISATIHATKLVISRYTCSYIQVKNHSVATSVNLLSKRALTLNDIYQHIQGGSNSSVISATIHVTELVISRYTCGSILEKSPLYANSATSHAFFAIIIIIIVNGGILSLTDSHHHHHGQIPTMVGICHGGNLPLGHCHHLYRNSINT